MIRVDPKAVERTLRKPHARPMEMGGRTMSGFVRVAPESYRTEASLRKWVMRGVDYLAARPPKASRGRGKSKSRA